MKRSWFLSWGRAAGLGLLLPACVGKEVSVGGEAGEGLDRCVGVADGCLPAVRAQPAQEMSAGSCDDADAAQLEVDYAFNVSERLCPRKTEDCGTAPDGSSQLCPFNIEDSCSVRVLAGRPAPDGSLWLVANKHGITANRNDKQSLWLGHVGSDGSDRGFFELAKGTELRGNTVYYAADLAVDAESRAHVIVNGNDPGPDADSEIRDHTWLARYDPDGRPSDGSWDLPGLARSFLALTPDGRVAVAGDAVNLERRAIAALLEADGSLVWSQPKVPSTGARAVGIAGMGVDHAGNVFVYTQRSSRDQGEFGLVMFDESGKLAWNRTFAGIFGDTAYGATVVLVVDGDGNATISGSPPGEPNQAPPFDETKLVSLDVNGDTRWTLEVRGAGPGVSVDAETGAVFLSGSKGAVRVSPAGTCSRLLWPPEMNDAEGTIEPGPDGHLYFVSSWKAGRYRALAPR